MKPTNLTNKFSFLLFAFIFISLSACNSNRSDAEIQEDVNQKIQENERYSGVNAQVQDRIVILSGACEGRDCSTRIADDMKGINGVDSVQNNINEGTNLTLRTSVHSIISRYEGVQADVADGVVVLRGSIDRNQVQPLMNELEGLGPRRIDNQLAIR